MMIRRKPIEEDDESPDRWLVSYDDFITLLFAFFVVMYAISSVNQSKYSDLTSSMGTAFSGTNTTDGRSGDIKNRSGIDHKIKGQPSSLIKPLPLSHLYSEKMRRDRETMTNMGVDLSNTLAPLISEGKVRVSQNNRGIRIDIHDSLLFSPGSAELASAASGIMNEIATEIKGNQRQIQVEGHTDNTEIHNATFFSNWELSAARAINVAKYLQQQGLDPAILSAAAFAEYKPVADNSTKEGRAKNRRIEITLVAKD